MPLLKIAVKPYRVLIEALVTEAEPHMFDQMLGTAEADFYGHQTKHGSFVFGGSSGYEAVNKDNGTPIWGLSGKNSRSLLSVLLQLHSYSVSFRQMTFSW